MVGTVARLVLSKFCAESQANQATDSHAHKYRLMAGLDLSKLLLLRV